MAATAKDIIREAEESGFGFLQKEFEIPMVNRARDTLEPNKLYFYTTSRFHQMFIALHLYDIRIVETTLHGHFNDGTTASN